MLYTAPDVGTCKNEGKFHPLRGLGVPPVGFERCHQFLPTKSNNPLFPGQLLLRPVPSHRPISCHGHLRSAALRLPPGFIAHVEDLRLRRVGEQDPESLVISSESHHLSGCGFQSDRGRASFLGGQDLHVVRGAICCGHFNECDGLLGGWYLRFGSPAFEQVSGGEPGPVQVGFGLGSHMKGHQVPKLRSLRTKRAEERLVTCHYPSLGQKSPFAEPYIPYRSMTSLSWSLSYTTHIPLGTGS